MPRRSLRLLSSKSRACARERSPGGPAVTAEGDGGLKYAGREMPQRSPPHAMCVDRPQRCLRWGDCRWMPQRRQACHQRGVCTPAGRCPSQCAWPSFRAVQGVELTRQIRDRWAAIKPCRPRGRFGIADRAAVVALPTCLDLARSAGVWCRDATACSSFFVATDSRSPDAVCSQPPLRFRQRQVIAQLGPPSTLENATAVSWRLTRASVPGRCGVGRSCGLSNITQMNTGHSLWTHPRWTAA